MTQLQLLTDLGNIAVAFLFWMTLLFPIVTGVFWPWWKSAWGLNIVFLEAALALALLPSILHRELGVPQNTYLFGWVAVTAIFAAGGIVLWRGILVFRTQWNKRHNDEGDV